ncbi:MAG: hypothetical protein KatS3mg076_1808 [Candidatus Binatia bacterium]|nr:MAG: hypothetical protein KatS3mg076_1808 [Candidatus Binatia bacterium]
MLLCALFVSGCGYHFTGTVSRLPAHVRSIHVGPIANETREAELGRELAFALEREILRRGTFRLAESPSEGDAVISGKIHSVELRPVAFDSRDQALQYELAVEADLRLEDRGTGETLWAVENLRQTDEYSASARVVVTSSSRFQRGRLEPRDLRGLTDIQLAESDESEAFRRAVEGLARRAYVLMVEGF